MTENQLHTYSAEFVTMIFFLAALLCLGDAAPVVDPLMPMASTAAPFIIGGSAVQITSHPHQVSLQTTSSGHSCGASILGTSKLVCAAHCTQGNPGSYQIRAGSNSYNSGGQVRGISRYVNHPNYNPSGSGIPNDVSTIHLSSALIFGTGVGSITMASSGDFAGQTATITGWGRTASGSIPISLQGVNIPVITNTNCASRMAGVGGAAILSGHICVYSGSTGACSGDSGGPMRVGSLLTGATSWGVVSGGTCLTSYPSVYTRITSYNSWISSN